MRIPSCPDGGRSGGGGENERKWRRPSTVDRSTGCRRPVDERAEAEVKGKDGEKERGRESEVDLGLIEKTKDALMRQKLNYI